MIYMRNNFCIDCDFDIRVVREEGNDVDLFIPIDNRTLNLYLNRAPEYLHSRLQFPMVRNIIIRFSLSNENNIATLHFLKSIDLQSSLVNFEINYDNYIIDIKDKKNYVEVQLRNRK